MKEAVVRGPQARLRAAGPRTNVLSTLKMKEKTPDGAQAPRPRSIWGKTSFIIRSGSNYHERYSVVSNLNDNFLYE
jgi:hypothetical protein